jgi:hypothetical protein
VIIDGAGTGTIESTENGTGLPNQNGSSVGVYMKNCDHCIVQNLTIGPIYQHTSPNDYPSDEMAVVVYRGSDVTFTHDVIHDADYAVYVRSDGSGQEQHMTFTYNDTYRVSHNYAVTSAGGVSTGPYVFAHNHMHDWANWDTTTDAYHHSGLHCFTGSGTGPGAHINGLYWYDNLIDGDLGENTTAGVFVEGSPRGDQSDTPCADSTSQLYFFNNVTVSNVGIFNGEMNFSSGHDYAYNNTFIGNSTTNQGGYAGGGGGIVVYQGSSSPTTATVQNNVFSTFNNFAGVWLASTDAGNPDYNVYANGGSQAWGANNTTCNNQVFDFQHFTGWKACVGDTHSTAVTNAKLNPDGTPQAGSPVLGAAANLTNLCAGDLTALCSDSKGDARPTSGNWDAGAFN